MNLHKGFGVCSFVKICPFILCMSVWVYECHSKEIRGVDSLLLHVGPGDLTQVVRLTETIFTQ